MRVFGEARLTEFSRKHAAAREPLPRFLEIARLAAWPHLPAVRQSFAAADYTASIGTLIFDIGGNKYRLIATVDFDEQILAIQRVLTHDEYTREVF